MDSFLQKFILALFFLHYGLANKESSQLQSDQSSLLFLKSRIKDPYNKLAHNWSTATSVCNWVGVTCDSHRNRVIELDISGMGLAGNIPPNIDNLSGLVSLNMAQNNFSGSIPPALFNVSSLEIIWLQGNRLSGNLPNDLCRNNLRRLTSLDLSSNNLDGEIPSSLGQCSALADVALSDNSFVGNVPRGIGNITLLSTLDLSFNDLNGEIPKEIDHLINLRIFWIGFNKFTGRIPREIGNMSSLDQLFLHDNVLTGGIPEEIFFLDNLEVLRLEYNNLMGPLYPTMFNGSSSLLIIDLSHNKLSGVFPKDIAKQKLIGNPLERGPVRMLNIIINFDISNNYFEGSIPQEIGNLTRLRTLNLAENYFSGEIPSTLDNIKTLTYLLLYSNNLSGEIPPSICYLRRLQYLHLSNNSLGGQVPKCLGNMTKSIHVLHLKDNHFQGLIPQTFSDGCALESFNLNGNHFQGTIPRSIVNCGGLQVLDVGNNELQGTFPFWMEALPELRVLVLKSNGLSGNIVQFPSKTEVLFPKLQVLDISYNTFTGSLPDRYIMNFRAMIDVKINITNDINLSQQYMETMEFVLKGLEQTLVRILTTFTTIDMSHNRFSGKIPESMGKLNSLKYLNLLNNGLTGNIPSSLGNISALESLDLSSNKLVGEIPWELTRLNFLSVLNLSNNNLVGPIPQFGQFYTFENNSYMGNSGLCGFPLTKKCHVSSLPTPPDQGDDSNFLDGFTWQAVVVGYGSGFLIGAVVGYFILRYGRPRWVVELFFGVGYKRKRNLKRNAVRRRT